MDETDKGTHKNWVFTLNNYTEEDTATISTYPSRDKRVRFVAYSFEIAPSTGTPHLQGFICFHVSTRFAAVRKMLPRAHIAVMRGKLSQNVDYCSKAGQLMKFGDEPTDPARNEQDRWSRTRMLSIEGRLEEVDDDIYIRYYNTLRRIKADHRLPPSDIEGMFENEWIWGPPGSGKSRRARDENPILYFKSLNKWWDNYNGEEVVLIDDFQPGFHMEYFIKIWADRYAFRSEIKGGSAMIRPRKIVVTSNYSIEQCFHGVDCDAVKRRFIEIHLR